MDERQFKVIRNAAGLSVTQLGEYLRVDARSVRRYEDGTRPISGPIEKLMEQLSTQLTAVEAANAKKG